MNHKWLIWQLKKVATLLSDGRYSGVTYGAAVGHMTPEAFEGGWILYLQTGDLMHLDFRNRRIDMLHHTDASRGVVAQHIYDQAELDYTSNESLL